MIVMNNATEEAMFCRAQESLSEVNVFIYQRYYYTCKEMEENHCT